MSHTEATIADTLAKRYKTQEWVFLRGVANTAGAVSRTADAMAFNLWPSRGLEIHGFEIKISRSDFKKELDDPAKAEAIAKYCDRWFLVVPAGLVQPHEIPVTWGLIVVKGDETKIEKPAPTLESPRQPPRHFWMAVMRRFYEQAAPESEITRQLVAARNVAWKEGYDAGIKSGEVNLGAAQSTAKQAEDRLRQADNQMQSWMEWFGARSPYELSRLPIREALHVLRPASRNVDELRQQLVSLINSAQTLLDYQQKLVAEAKQAGIPVVKSCGECGGSGAIEDDRGVYVRQCSRCDGKGKVQG